LEDFAQAFELFTPYLAPQFMRESGFPELEIPSLKLEVVQGEESSRFDSFFFMTFVGSAFIGNSPFTAQFPDGERFIIVYRRLRLVLGFLSAVFKGPIPDNSIEQPLRGRITPSRQGSAAEL